MGCSNVTCGISAISMSDNAAVLIPLVEESHAQEAINGATIMGFHTGICALYKPSMLPIFGKLDKYGQLENIEKNSNTKAIEKFYKLPIQDFAEVVSNGRYTDAKINRVDTSRWAGMYVHREIFDMMVARHTDEWGRPGKPVWEAQGMIDDGVLTELGFGYVKQERPSQNNMPCINLYLSKKIPEIELRHNPTHHSAQLTCGKKQTMWECYIKTLVETIEEWTGKSPISQRTRKLWETLNPAYMFADRMSREFLANEKHDTLYCMSLGRDVGFDISGTDFADIYGGTFQDRSITKAVADFRLFMNNMFDVNRMFFPTIHGRQFGNHFASEMLYEKSLEIVRKLQRKS